MNPHPTDPNEQQLTKVLREWKVNTPLPPRFQERVWQRIGRAGHTTSSSWWLNLRDVLETALGRPVLAGSYLMLLLATGLAAGYTQARQTNTHFRYSLESRYVQSVDPYHRMASHRR